MTALSVFNKGRRKVIGGGLFQLFSGWGGGCQVSCTNFSWGGGGGHSTFAILIFTRHNLIVWNRPQANMPQANMPQANIFFYLSHSRFALLSKLYSGGKITKYRRNIYKPAYCLTDGVALHFLFDV